MSPLFEFKCPRNHVHEALITADESWRLRRCPVCGALAERQQPNPNWQINHDAATRGESEMSRAITRAQEAERRGGS